MRFAILALLPALWAQPHGSTMDEYETSCVDVYVASGRVMEAMGFELLQASSGAVLESRFVHKRDNANWRQVAARAGQPTKETAGLGSRPTEALIEMRDVRIDGRLGCRAYLRLDFAAYRTGIRTSGWRWMESNGRIESAIHALTRNDLVAQGRIKE